MEVKVGNSWVSEAALSYAKAKADSGASVILKGLSDRYPGMNFSTNTQAFSQKGTNNIQIAPSILAQMQNNPDKRIEYEALIYDCAKLISTGAMVGVGKAGDRFVGRSLVADPLGRTVVAANDASEQLLTCELDLAQIARARDAMPLLRHRRGDLYGALVDAG